MPLPSLKAQFAALLQTPSISCTQPDLDQSNLPVIHLLADWLGQLGFDCRIQPVPDAPGKANLIASLGSGPGGLVLGTVSVWPASTSPPGPLPRLAIRLALPGASGTGWMRQSKPSWPSQSASR